MTKVSYKSTKEGEIKYVQNLNEEGVQWLFDKPFGLTDFTSVHLKDFSIMLTLLKPQKYDLILDIGCGSGWTTEFLARCGLNVIGLDIASSMLKIAKERIKKMYTVDYAEEFPFKNNIFDGILFYDSLHHIPDWKAAVHNAFLALKENGKVIFLEPSSDHFDTGVMEKYGVLERGIHPFELKKYLKKIGFKDVTIRLPVYYPVHVETLKGKVIRFLKQTSFRSIPLIDFCVLPMHSLLAMYLLKKKCIVIATK